MSIKMKKFVLFCVLSMIISALPAAAEDNAIRIEGEWCEKFNAPAYSEVQTDKGLATFPDFKTGGEYKLSALSGGTAAAVVSDEIPDGGYWLTYDFYVPEEGFYSLEYVGSKQGKTSFETQGDGALSAFTVQVNGGKKRFINPRAQTGGFNLSSIPASVRNTFAKYRFNIYLNSGMNTVTFRVEEANSSGRAVFYLDYFELTYTGTNARFETEAYSRTSPESSADTTIFPTNAQAGLSGGKLLQLSAPYTGQSTGISAFADIYIPEDGNYRIGTVCGELGRSYTTDFEVICGSESVLFSKDTAAIKGSNGYFWDRILLKS